MRIARKTPSMLLAAFAACLLVLPATASDADARLSGKEWKELQQRYAELFAKRGEAEAKAALMKEVAADGTGRAWRLMKDALVKEVQTLAGVQKELVDAAEEQGEIVKRGMKGYTATDENRMKELMASIEELGKLAQEERRATDAIVTAICEGPPKLREIIIKQAKSSKPSDWPFRAAAVAVAARSMDEKGSGSYLLRTLAKDSDPRVRLSALDALATTKEGWEHLVIGRLADPHWSVVLRAAQILEERKVHKAVPHLINALTGASPRLAQGVGAALKALTGENFEPYADVWTKWWEEHKDDFEKDVEVKTGKKPEFPRIHFYGVEIKSDRVLFIIDVSGSMKLEIKTKDEEPKKKKKDPVVTGPGNPPPPPDLEDFLRQGKKIDIAKHELKKAIERMPKEFTFNIIQFNQGAKPWQEKMVKASKKNKEAAYTWIRGLKPSGSTYTDGALRMGFKMAGLINFDDKYPNIALDTIVLLSDGAPTDTSFPTAKLMDPEVILGNVREWNKHGKVVIHCIAVNMPEGNVFMEKLAKENGGTFVDR